MFWGVPWIHWRFKWICETPCFNWHGSHSTVFGRNHSMSHICSTWCFTCLISISTILILLGFWITSTQWSNISSWSFRWFTYNSRYWSCCSCLYNINIVDFITNSVGFYIQLKRIPRRFSSVWHAISRLLSFNTKHRRVERLDGFWKLSCFDDKGVFFKQLIITPCGIRFIQLLTVITLYSFIIKAIHFSAFK